VRRGHQIDLTIACAIVDQYVGGPTEMEAKNAITRLAEARRGRPTALTFAWR
jgi:S-adenosylmethionine synthetase